ncbi:MAG: carboxylating nicotinate-nucleotide diphosphorylase [Candidatus Heimdallarchaeum aukensis]|uniref:Nicotinate-nucleotide pyrophosphorylase [carboxylating] n=1 Tax=Candidatus Heimdallarchaeum aukensis TaxID=2876573 RepID=A0A9Y1BKX6_9ARCH|nr:MAG: carboxylating nicotinate-nucleotide diphosphorylase [Candidatus Heimdallarchaeum aukensis]
MIPEILIEEDIKEWLKEDIPYWDITTNLLPDKKVKAKIFAKQEGIIAGLTVAEKIFTLLGAEWNANVQEGQKVSKKQVIAEIKGNIKSLLQGERIALNILGRMSGIATTTAQMIEKTRKINPNLKICATRKTVPGLAKYDKYAVTIGGGDTHRFNLSDMVLLKENHLSLFSSITEAIAKAKETVSFSKKIEVEVKNEEEAIEAAKAGADIIMLDNFKPIQAKHVVKKIREINQNILIELSGNIKIDNIEDFELENVNHISSGSLTHSVKNFDLSMLIE